MIDIYNILIVTKTIAKYKLNIHNYSNLIDIYSLLIYKIISICN